MIASLTEIPAPEHDRLADARGRALALGAAGRFGAGYVGLADGLQRAEALHADGIEWGAALADRYREALEEYALLCAPPPAT
jgi:hypothetical protein